MVLEPVSIDLAKVTAVTHVIHCSEGVFLINEEVKRGESMEVPQLSRQNLKKPPVAVDGRSKACAGLSLCLIQLSCASS